MKALAKFKTVPRYEKQNNRSLRTTIYYFTSQSRINSKIKTSIVFSRVVKVIDLPAKLYWYFFPPQKKIFERALCSTTFVTN